MAYTSEDLHSLADKLAALDLNPAEADLLQAFLTPVADGDEVEGFVWGGAISKNPLMVSGEEMARFRDRVSAGFVAS